MVEETICLQCGNRGFDNAFVYCIRCLDFAVHRYCLGVIPDTFDEVVSWLCDDCEVKVRKQSSVLKHGANPSQTRHHEASKNIKGLCGNGKKENGLVVVEENENICKDGSEQAYDACAKSGESASQHNPAQLDGKNDENAILLPADVSKRSQQSSSLPQLDGNLTEPIDLSAGCLKKKKTRKRKRNRNIMESTTEKDQHRLATSHNECVKVDINECTRLESDPIELSAGCPEQKNTEIKNKRKRKRKKERKRNIMESTSEKDQHRLDTTSYNECVKVDINECTRSVSEPIELSAGCPEQKNTEIKNKRKRKRNNMECTTKKDQHRLATTTYNECGKVDINECMRSASDSTLPSKVKENDWSKQKDSITDLGIIGVPADHPVVSNNGPSRRLKKKKPITPSESIPQEQVHGTGVAQPLENEFADLSTVERDLGSSTNPIENRVAEDKEEQTSTTCQSRDTSKYYPNDFGFPVAQPVAMPIWRGNFNIGNEKYDNIDELIAHISNKACQKVYEATSQFQPVLHLEMLPKSDIWPKSFMSSEPNGDSIALYFFPSNISEHVFDQLVEEMMHKELAFKACVQNAELLIFTSTELPLRYWRFRSKYYLWGVFREKQAIAPSNSLGKGCDDRSPISTLTRI